MPFVIWIFLSIMAKADKLFQQFEEEWTYWKRALEGYTDESLMQLTEASDWTMGQVYDHLIMTSYNLSCDWIPACLATYEETGHLTKTAIGTTFFLVGRFPPIRAKFVGPAPAQPQSKAEIETRFDELLPAVRDARDLLNTATQSGKKKHFALGHLDGWEWYRFITMHFRHHRRQKKRIDELLG